MIVFIILGAVLVALSMALSALSLRINRWFYELDALSFLSFACAIICVAVAAGIYAGDVLQ